jgi:hypothetical protein
MGPDFRRDDGLKYKVNVEAAIAHAFFNCPPIGSFLIHLQACHNLPGHAGTALHCLKIRQTQI